MKKNRIKLNAKKKKQSRGIGSQRFIPLKRKRGASRRRITEQPKMAKIGMTQVKRKDQAMHQR